MSPVTMEHLRAAQTHEEMFPLLRNLLEERLPDSRADMDAFVARLKTLTPGLRAMAATYELDVSLALDDLGWHFGNWHHLDLAEETLAGLHELGAAPLAEVFAAALREARVHWEPLGRETWTDWYGDSELEKRLGPLNDRAWKLLENEPMGILSYWTRYARQFPERVL